VAGLPLAGSPAFFYARLMFELETGAGVARLRIRRPEARNAIRLDAWAELSEHAEAAAQEGAKVLIVGGETGGAFSAGADLAGFDEFRDSGEARSAFRAAMRSGLDRLRDLSIPTIALVEGPCYGAGVALAIACDIRVAGPGAQFATTPAKLGISYPQQDVHRLVSLVGAGQSSRLLFTAEAIGAAEAQRIGLVEIFADNAESAAAALASAIASNELDSLSTLKRSIRLASHGVVVDEEQDRVFDALLGSDNLHRKLAAWRSGRR
jgi:enoyl-CoA hydratase/carnithine racemase